MKEVNGRRKDVVSDVEEIDEPNDKEVVSEIITNKISRITGNFSNESQTDTRILLSNQWKRFIFLSVFKQAIADLKYGIGFDVIQGNHLKESNNFTLK